MNQITEILLLAGGVYLLSGVGFAIPFAFRGVEKIDPQARHGSWGFRLLVIPGAMLLWPLLAKRWLRGCHGPPEEKNSHRQAARSVRRSKGESTP